jgi:PAS domain-containing protein
MTAETIRHDLDELVAASPLVAHLAVLDAQGQTLAASRVPSVDMQTAPDPDLLAGVANAQDRGVRIGAPLVSMAGGWMVQVARGFKSPTGAPLGLLLATARLRFLDDMMAGLSANPDGIMALLSQDGILLARQPRVAGTVGRRFRAPGTGVLAAGSDELPFELVSRVDGRERLVVRKAVPGYPLVAVVGKSMASVLKSWWRLAFSLGIGVAALELGVAGLVILGLRQMRQQALLADAEAARLAAERETALFDERARARSELALAQERERAEREQRLHFARFATAMDQLVQGVAVFNAEGRLTLFNERLAGLFKTAAVSLQGGISVDRLISLAEAGGADRPSLLGIADRIAYFRRRRRGGTFIAPIASDGRSLSVHVQPVAAGGYVVTFEDVTERQVSHARIVHMAHHDALTGLSNRVLLQQRLERPVRAS